MAVPPNSIIRTFICTSSWAICFVPSSPYHTCATFSAAFHQRRLRVDPKKPNGWRQGAVYRSNVSNFTSRKYLTYPTVLVCAIFSSTSHPELV